MAGFGITYFNGITAGNPVKIYNPNDPETPNSTVNNVCLGYSGYYIEGQPYGTNTITWSEENASPNSGFSWSQTGNRAYFNFYYVTTQPRYLKGTVTNGCGSFSRTFAFVPFNCNGTGNPCEEFSKNRQFTITPNPATDQVKIDVINRPPPPPDCESAVPVYKSGVGRIFSVVNVYNRLGTLVKTYRAANSKNAVINIKSLIAGSYMVEIISGTYKEKHQVIVQK